MGAKGKPLSDETKKKISEALRKNFGTPESTNRSASAQAYLNKFVDKKVEYEDFKNQRDDLIAQSKALGRKKSSASARKEINAQIKDLTSKMKVLRKTLVSIKAEATGERAKKNAELYIKKAEARVGQYNALIMKISDLLVRTEDADRRKRLQDRLNRALTGKVGLEGRIGQAQDVASGKQTKKQSNAFNFSDHLEFMEDHIFDPARELTMQEKRVNLFNLNDQFNEEQGVLSDDLVNMTNEELDRISKQAQDKLTAGDVAAIAAVAFLFRGKIYDLIRGKVKDAYEIGKSSAISELAKAGVIDGGRPIVTPLLDTQLMNLDADEIAEAYVSTLESTAKSALKAGVASDASVSATIAAMRSRVQDEASKAITNIVGTTTGQYINRGRDMVFMSHLTKIVSFQRSEVLDMKTCATCLSLDELVITPDDPMRHLEIVHTHCRGVWVPIFTVDEIQPDVTGIPTKVKDSFDLIDGRPTVNAFKNMKKPVNDVSKGAQVEIRKRLK